MLRICRLPPEMLPAMFWPVNVRMISVPFARICGVDADGLAMESDSVQVLVKSR